MYAPVITKDFASKKLVIEKVFAAPRAKVWKAHSDDSLLIQWWGPKDWPASSISFDFKAGGHWHYCMTGPDGVKVYGWADYIEIQPLVSILGKDCFVDEKGIKDLKLPSNTWYTQFSDTGTETKVRVELTFETTENMQTLIDMGFEAGFSDALDNLDTLLKKM